MTFQHNQNPKGGCKRKKAGKIIGLKEIKVFYGDQNISNVEFFSDEFEWLDNKKLDRFRNP